MKNPKQFVLGMLVVPMALLGLGIALAGSVTIPNTFVAATPAVAAEVNANFAAVKAAVDDNDARITALEGNRVLSSGVTLRTMRGSVNADGTLWEGAGFTSMNVAVGTYAITYNTAFSGTTSSLIATVVLGGVGASSFNGSRDSTSVNVGTANGANALADLNFDFIAMGAN